MSGLAASPTAMAHPAMHAWRSPSDAQSSQGADRTHGGAHTGGGAGGQGITPPLSAAAACWPARPPAHEACCVCTVARPDGEPGASGVGDGVGAWVFTGGRDGVVLRWDVEEASGASSEDLSEGEGAARRMWPALALCRHRAPVMDLEPIESTSAGSGAGLAEGSALRGGKVDSILSCAADGGVLLWSVSDGRCVGACVLLPSVGSPRAAKALPCRSGAPSPLAALACARSDHGVNRAGAAEGCVVILNCDTMSALRYLEAPLSLLALEVHVIPGGPPLGAGSYETGDCTAASAGSVPEDEYVLVAAGASDRTAWCLGTWSALVTSDPIAPVNEAGKDAKGVAGESSARGGRPLEVTDMVVPLPHASSGGLAWPTHAGGNRWGIPAVAVAPGGQALVRRTARTVTVTWARNGEVIASLSASKAAADIARRLGASEAAGDESRWAGAMVVVLPLKTSDDELIHLLAWLADGSAVVYELPLALGGCLSPAKPHWEGTCAHSGGHSFMDMEMDMEMDMDMDLKLGTLASGGGTQPFPKQQSLAADSATEDSAATDPRVCWAVAGVRHCQAVVYGQTGDHVSRSITRVAARDADEDCPPTQITETTLFTLGSDGSLTRLASSCLADAWVDRTGDSAEPANDSCEGAIGASQLSVCTAFPADAGLDAAGDLDYEMGWLVACGYSNGTIAVHQLPGSMQGSDAPLCVLQGAHDSRVRCLAPSRRAPPRGAVAEERWERLLVSSGDDWTVRVWAALNGEALLCVSPHAGPSAALFAPPCDALFNWSQCIGSIGEDGGVALVSVADHGGGAQGGGCNEGGAVFPRTVVASFPGHPSMPVDGVWDARRGTLACLCIDRVRATLAEGGASVGPTQRQSQEGPSTPGHGMAWADVAEHECAQEGSAECLLVWDVDTSSLQRVVHGRDASALLYHLKARARASTSGGSPARQAGVRLSNSLHVSSPMGGMCVLACNVPQLLAQPVPQTGAHSWADGGGLLSAAGVGARAALSIALSGWLCDDQGRIRDTMVPHELRTALCGEGGAGVAFLPTVAGGCMVTPALEGVAGALTVQMPHSGDALRTSSAAHAAVSRLGAAALAQRLMTLGEGASSASATVVSMAVKDCDDAARAEKDAKCALASMSALEVYAAHWQSPCETLRMASRTLLQASAAGPGTMEIIAGAAFDEAALVQARLAPRARMGRLERGDVERAELHIIMGGAAALAAPLPARATVASAVGPALAALVHAGPSAGVAAAADILADGIDVWQENLTPRQMAALVVDAFALSAELQSVGLQREGDSADGASGEGGGAGSLSAMAAAAAREATARLLAALLRADTALVLRRIKWQLEEVEPGSPAHATAFVAVTRAVSARPEALRPHLPLLGHVLHQAMQPANDELRRSCLPRCMALCRTLAETYHEVAFHEQGMRLAMADTMPSAASVVTGAGDDEQVAAAAAAAEAAAAAAGGARPAALAFDLGGAARMWRFERSCGARAGSNAVRAALAARSRAATAVGAAGARADVHMLSFSPDGRHLASLSSRDCALRVWPLARVAGDGASVFGAALSSLGATSLGAAVAGAGSGQDRATSVGVERCKEVEAMPPEAPRSRQFVFEWSRGGAVAVRRTKDLSVLASV